jgi:hypothetical protein
VRPRVALVETVQLDLSRSPPRLDTGWVKHQCAILDVVLGINRPATVGALGLLGGQVEAFLPPDRLHAIFAHVPALAP